MRSIIAQLKETCREHPLIEKWLIVPTLRIGHQWLDQIAQQGQPVVNLRLQTVSRMALDQIESEAIPIPGKRMESCVGPFILQAIWTQGVGSQTRYFNTLSPNQNLFQGLFATLESLRLGGLSSEVLLDEHFESAGKRADIALLLFHYEQYIRQHQLLDRAEILLRALSILERGRSILPPDAILLIPEILDLSLLERRFVQHLSLDRGFPIARSSIVEQTKEPTTNLDRLRWLPNPSEAPEPFRDDSVRIVRAIGETNEIRAVFRRCLQEKIPLDTVELLYPDAQTYFAPIYETGLAVFPSNQQDSLPITFAEGIPVRYSRPGRLLQRWLEWSQTEYSQTFLIRMLEDDLLFHPQFEAKNFRMDVFIHTLRSLVIGSKRDRYKTRIQLTLDALKKQLAHSFAPHESAEEEISEYLLQIKQEIESLEILQSIVKDWFSILPPPSANANDWLDSIEALFHHYSRSITELDHHARNRILEELNALKNGFPDWGNDPPIDILEWLSSLPRQFKVMGSAPRAGCLHVAPIHDGGHSGRFHTFLVGLDDTRFPGAGLQDPFLLDHEREKISPHLSTASSHQRDTLDRFYQLLGRLHGTLSLSFSSCDLSDEREVFPSSLLLNVYRILSGNREGDPTSLAEWLPTANSFSPSDPTHSLNESEEWMGRMAQQTDRSNSFADIVQWYPHLHCGWIAQQNRLSEQFTEYDGWVSESGIDLDPTQIHGLIMSASRFETLGTCPLRFFFAHGLKLHTPDEIDRDPDRWLDPLQFGSLLHEILEIFMRELIEHQERPHFDTHWPRLKQILDEQAQVYRDYIPPPNQSAWTRQCEELEQCANIFLRDEEILCLSHTPVFVEASLGQPSVNAFKTASSFPIHIALSNGVQFRARGQIDRIDRVGDIEEETYAVWDYKSGSSYKYDRKDPFRQGRVMQHSLYYELMIRWLKSEVSPKATLRQFGYFFPSEKGKGERIAWSEPELAQRANLFRSLCQLIAQGIFAPTDDNNDCQFCEYRSICRDTDSVTRFSRAKLNNPLNVRLQPMRELRNDE